MKCIENRDGNPSNFWTGFGFLQESVKKKWRIPDSYFWRIRIPDSSSILKGLFLNLSATYVLKINVLGVFYNSLPRIEPDFKRFYI